MQGFDPYTVGARTLIDVLGPVADSMPELGWEPHLRALIQQLDTLNQWATPPSAGLEDGTA